jgi:hypothetical protein
MHDADWSRTREPTIVGHYAFDPVDTKVLYLRQQTGFMASGQVIDEDTVPLTWVRESHSELLILFKGRCIRHCGSYSDFYGFLTSLESALEEVSGLLYAWNIEATSELEVVVVSSLTDHPTLGWVNYALFKVLPQATLLQYTDAAKIGQNFNQESFPHQYRKWVEPTTHGMTKIWSSKWAAEECKLAQEKFRMKAEDNKADRKIHRCEEIDTSK